LTEVTTSQTVHSLICHRDVDMALLCLNSLLKFSVEPLRLALHDDGSLTSGDMAKLREGLPGTTIISRAEADQAVSTTLSHYPHCANFRQRSPTALKLIDVPLLSHNDICCIDTDVLFFRPFLGLFRWPSSTISAIFMRDYQDAYSLKPWQLGSLKVPSHVNVGLMYVRKKAYDLDFMEKVLKDLGSRSKQSEDLHWFQEQTCWAIFAGYVGCQLWNPNQIRVLNEQDTLDHSLVAGHFVSPIRHKLSAFFEQAKSIDPSSSPITMNTIEAQDYNIRNWARVRLARRFNRVFHP
jgi:hypothetical protein